MRWCTQDEENASITHPLWVPHLCLEINGEGKLICIPVTCSLLRRELIVLSALQLIKLGYINAENQLTDRAPVLALALSPPLSHNKLPLNIPGTDGKSWRKSLVC